MTTLHQNVTNLINVGDSQRAIPASINLVLIHLANHDSSQSQWRLLLPRALNVSIFFGWLVHRILYVQHWLNITYMWVILWRSVKAVSGRVEISFPCRDRIRSERSEEKANGAMHCKVWGRIKNIKLRHTMTLLYDKINVDSFSSPTKVLSSTVVIWLCERSLKHVFMYESHHILTVWPASVVLLSYR